LFLSVSIKWISNQSWQHQHWANRSFLCQTTSAW
jgi:hypothetical protein